jgi:serine/threonine-protein kinase
VYRGFDDLRRRPVRIEIIRRFDGELSSSNALRAFRTNISALAELRHDAILQHYNEFEVQTSLVIVSEYFSETTLRTFTAEIRPWPVLREIFTQVVGALRHAHDRRIVHRHVTPECILIGSDPRPSVRLCGFFGAAVNSNSVVHASERSNPYQPPEYDDERFWRTPMEDAFAIGRCICAALTGNPRQLPSSNVPPEVLALLPRLFSDHPADRKAAWERLATIL